ncbi:MAG: copper-binding protein [Hyphomicrobiaceae bacterium]|nr:copper-binding protein [Hyphomicrobiaceae bacterium]
MRITRSAQAIAIAAVIWAATPAIGAELPSVKGEITKVDASAGKLTIKHEPIPNLEMDAMTMVFKAADAAMLAVLNPGDKVNFQADKVNGQITIVKVEKAK